MNDYQICCRGGDCSALIAQTTAQGMVAGIHEIKSKRSVDPATAWICLTQIDIDISLVRKTKPGQNILETGSWEKAGYSTI